MHLEPPKVQKTKEHRIKVALKDKPKKTSKKSASVKNKIKPDQPAPAMPQGKQLKKLTKEPKKKAPQKKKTQKKEIKKLEKKIKKVREEIAKAKKQTHKPKKKKVQESKPKKIVKIKRVKKEPEHKKVDKLVKRQDINITKKPIKKTGLYAALSKPQKINKVAKSKRQEAGSQIGKDFKEAYGEAFGKLSEGEQKYIIDNQEIMRRITQEQLNRLAPVNIPRNLHVNTMNIIEFYLHPNGDISGLKIITPSSVNLLDDTSIQTVEYSYHRYPLPKQKTLIRYKVGFWLGGRPH